MRKLLLAAVLLALIGVAPAPATADHSWDEGYWNRAPRIAWDGINAANIQDAAYYWQDRGFDGYYPPLPDWNHGGRNCATAYEGWINVCTVARSIVHAYCGHPCDGVSENFTYANNTIAGGYILITNDLSPWDRQRVWRHEFGHAIGLGHTPGTSCVMHDPPYIVGETCFHDAYEIGVVMYPGKRF